MNSSIDEVELPSRVPISSALHGCNHSPPTSVAAEAPNQYAVAVYYPPRLIPEETQGSPLSRHALFGGESPVIGLMQEDQLEDARRRSAWS